ncbi:MAG: PorV/PorQ family protein [Gemmatimonadaceae bacterium]
MTILRTVGAGLLLASTLWGSPALGQIGGLLPTPEDPPSRQGTRGGGFLHIGIGARGNAMAGAVGSSTRGPMAWFWNPAGVSATEGFSIAAGRQNLYGDLGLHQTYAALNMPILGGVVGIAFNNLNSGDITRTTETFPFGRRGQGDAFQWNSTAVSLGYGRRLTDRLSVGGDFKFVTEGITNASLNWLAFDVGTQFQTGIYGLVLGGTLQHIGGGARVSGPLITRQINDANINRENTRYDLFTNRVELPTAFRFSVGEDLYGGPESLLGGGGGVHRVTAELAVNDAVDLATQFAVGSEYSFRNTLFVRGGKKFYNDDRDVGSNSSTYGLSGGFGLRFGLSGRNVRFDYSYTALGALQDIQVFSFEFGR